MSKQTPVEWFAKELRKRFKRNNAHLTCSEWASDMINKLLEQAKEKENSQRESDFVDGYKAKAKNSNLIFDEVSEMYAKQLVKNKLEKE